MYGLVWRVVQQSVGTVSHWLIRGMYISDYPERLSWLKSGIFFNHSIHIFCFFFHFLVGLLSETQAVMITQHSAADVFPWPQQLSTWCSNLLHKCMDSTGSVFSTVLGKQIFGLPPPTPPHSISLLLPFVCTLHHYFWTGFVVHVWERKKKTRGKMLPQACACFAGAWSQSCM